MTRVGTERFEAIARPLKVRRTLPLKSMPQNLPSFKTGGRIQRTGPLFAHKGEFVLPKGVKPTTGQKAAVRRMGGKC